VKRTKICVYKALGFVALVLLVSACASVRSGGKENEPNPDVTSKVISEAANQAGLYFLSTPNTAENAVAIQNFKNAGLAWADDLAIFEGSSSNFISGRTNQLAAVGSGFQFTIRTKSPSSGLRAAIGFNSVFTFTPEADNLGAETYNALVNAMQNFEQLESPWVSLEYTVLTNLGIRVYTKYLGQDKDITDRITFRINVAQKDRGILLFSYGAVMADKTITNFENEGRPLFVSDEDELIWSDGTPDNVITAEWWIGKSS
jgi:hypothetical protein